MNSRTGNKLGKFILVECVVLAIVLLFGVFQRREASEVPVNLEGFKANAAF